MKKLIYLFVTLIVLGCDSENAPDCFQTDGNPVTEPVEVGTFKKIRIEDDISLRIRQGEQQAVLLETRANLLNEITVIVEGETLVARNNNGCNLIRDYATTTLVVTTPFLEEIRNSSEFNVTGEGALRFPELRLVSNTTGGIEDTRKSGDFTLTVECENFVVEANGFSGFYIDGFSESATLSFEDEIPLFDGPNFIVNDLRVFQRSANRMIVNPQERIRGVIRGTGDIISLNRPAVVDVEEFFTGSLIFKD